MIPDALGNTPSMGIFERFRRAPQPAPEQADEALPEDKLPRINDRVTIARPGSRPVASRVEDQTDERAGDLGR